MRHPEISFQSLRDAFSVITKKDLKKVFWIISIQVLLGFLDLFGVVAVGLLSALSIQKFGSGSSNFSLPEFLALTPLEDLEFGSLVALLACAGIFLLASKSILSFFFTRKIIRFFSFRAARFSTDLMEKLLAGSIGAVQKNTFQHSIFAVSRGVEVLFVQVLATIVVIISDLSLVIILTIGLLIIDFKTTLALALVFGLIGLMLFKFLSTKSRSQGILLSQKSVQSDEKIYEMLQLYREMKVSGRQDHYLGEFNSIRSAVAKIGSDLNFLPYVVKYAIELGFLLAVIIVGVVNFFFGDLLGAIQSSSMLIVAGSRIAPSLIRLQQGMVSVSVGLGQTKPTLEYFKEFKPNCAVSNRVIESINTHAGFSPEISLKNVSFSYPNSLSPAIENINLEIDAGTFVAIVGPSGSGKSTLVDLILGVSEPSFGEVKVSGLTPTQCVSKWSGAISYVPQEVSIINGSVWENVTLGMPKSAAAERLVKEVLSMAQLEEYSEDKELHSIKNAPEFKSKVSGGQRQRLGISRALFTKPLLLVLDESTSSLDAKTEYEISKAISSIRSNKTIIVIAHRLSTVMAADKVVYISDGKIISVGTFDQVRTAVPEFDVQASLMGIPQKPL